MSKKKFPTINPATGEKIVDIAEGDKADVDLAVKAAQKAFARGSEWRNMDGSQRAKLMHKLADLIERDVVIIANLESMDMGKIFDQSFGSVYFSAMMLRHYAGWCDKVRVGK